MNPAKHFLGLFAVIGNWPNWERYFDLSRRGLKASFVALALALPALYLVAFAVTRQRAELLSADFVPPASLPFLALAALFLLSFPMIALMITMVFDKPAAFKPWVITRHWAVFFLSLVVATLFGLTLLGWLPFVVANGAALAAYLGMLAIDIRLVKRVVELNWGASILVGCVVVATGLTLLQFGMSEIR